MDKPLSVWYCDICGEKIDNVGDGYVIWKSKGVSGSRDFKIIHQSKCDPNEGFPLSMDLESFLETSGVQKLLSELSAGPFIAGTHCRITDFNEYVDFFRRVQTPYYEEARRKFHYQSARELMDGANEIAPYLEENLKIIIQLEE